MSPLTLTGEQWRAMQKLVAAAAPLEACGLLAGMDGRCHAVYPLENAAHSPTRYRIDPAEQVQALMDMEARGLDLIAIYHSHPAGPPHPSATDIAEASYPDVLHLIWSPVEGQWQCGAFQIGLNGASAVELDVSDPPATSP